MNNELIERITGHFDAQAIKEIAVPEWGPEGQPLVIYFKPFTLREKNKLHKRTMGNNEIQAMAHILIEKALGEDLKPLFTDKDAAALLTEADTKVIERIIGEMGVEDSPGAIEGE